MNTLLITTENQHKMINHTEPNPTDLKIISTVKVGEVKCAGRGGGGVSETPGLYSGLVCLFIGLEGIALSTAKGHLRAFQ